jgi:hypothetical protein
MVRQTKLTEKDMDVIREGDSVHNQIKKSSVVLKDYSMRHRVVMEWDLNSEAKRDMMFRLKVDDKEVILDWEEVMRSGRFI